MRHNKSVMRNMMMITQLGLSVMMPVFVCILAGYYIDRYAGTNLTFFLMILGFLAGGWNGYKIAKATTAMNEKEEKKEEQERKERLESQNETLPKVHKPKEASRVRRHEDGKL